MHHESHTPPRQLVRHSLFAHRRRGMTLIELLIVIVIIGILVSAVMVASTSLIGKSKTRNTQAVLQIVADAAEQFKRSETEKPTLTRNAAYKKRYGLYPPDELEVFSPIGVPGNPPSPVNLATPAGSVIFPAPAPYTAMRFYTDGTAADALEHRDLAALIVAIESQGGEASAILDRISDRNRSAGVLDPTTKNPAQYLSRPTGINSTSVNNAWGPEDLQIRYILDDWGIPLTYFTQRDNNPDPAEDTKTVSTNHKDWNHVSTEIVKLNDGKPVIMSYGPNGKDQLTKDVMEDVGKATIPFDFENSYGAPVDGDVIDHPLNADNIYSKQGLAELLIKGLP